MTLLAKKVSWKLVFELTYNLLKATLNPTRRLSIYPRMNWRYAGSRPTCAAAAHYKVFARVLGCWRCGWTRRRWIALNFDPAHSARHRRLTCQVLPLQVATAPPHVRRLARLPAAYVPRTPIVRHFISTSQHDAAATVYGSLKSLSYFSNKKTNWSIEISPHTDSRTCRV